MQKQQQQQIPKKQKSRTIQFPFTTNFKEIENASLCVDFYFW